MSAILFRRFRLHLGLVPILLGWGGLVAAWGQTQETMEEEAAGREIEDIINIELRTDVRIFTVMAALNAAGFDYEVPGRVMSPQRAAVREAVSTLPPELLRRLQVQYRLRRFPDPQSIQTAYTSLALLVEGPPDFKLQPDAPMIPSEVREIFGFSELLPDFYVRAGIPELWERYRVDYTREIEAYRPVIREAIHQALRYSRIPPRVVLDRQIVIMADLLNYHDVVNARNLEKTYFLVVGPSDDPSSNYIQVQHEYLHFLIDPLVEKHAGTVMKERKLIEVAERQPNIGRDFRNRFLLIVGESLIEALLHRMHPPGNLENKSIELFRRGLIYFPYFMDALTRYEQEEGVSLPAFLEEALASLDQAEVAKEESRIAQIETEKHAQAEAAQAEEAEKAAAIEERNRISRLLAEAGRLLAEKQFAEAEVELKKILDLNPEDGNAHFYLAQASAQSGNYPTAAEHYRKAEAATGVEPWVRAWSSVRLGRYLAHEGNTAEARRKFESVLALEGELNGAREAAQASLQELDRN